MARYFFHLHDAMDVTDEEGVELADRERVREFAINSIRDVASESVSEGRLNLDHFIEVMDDQGHQVMTVGFSEAIHVSAKGAGLS
jgi:hypothetical protein